MLDMQIRLKIRHYPHVFFKTSGDVENMYVHYMRQTKKTLDRKEV